MCYNTSKLLLKSLVPVLVSIRRLMSPVNGTEFFLLCPVSDCENLIM